MNLLMEYMMKIFTIFLFAMILLFAGCDLFPDNDPKMVVGILDHAATATDNFSSVVLTGRVYGEV